MATFFDSNESNSFRDEVPWHNVYNKDPRNIGNETIVHRVVVCDTGLLLIASDFKDFVYKNKKLYEQILEALEYYVERPSDSIPLILRSCERRASDIGILDEYEGQGVWMKDPKGFIFDSHDQTSKKDSPSSNPFLPTNTKRARKAKPGTGNTSRTSQMALQAS